MALKSSLLTRLSKLAFPTAMGKRSFKRAKNQRLQVLGKSESNLWFDDAVTRAQRSLVAPLRNSRRVDCVDAKVLEVFDSSWIFIFEAGFSLDVSKTLPRGEMTAVELGWYLRGCGSGEFPDGGLRKTLLRFPTCIIERASLVALRRRGTVVYLGSAQRLRIEDVITFACTGVWSTEVVG